MITFASVRERNHSRLGHSSRNLPLKLSVTPFCQGLPGSINAVPMPCATIQDNRALDTNSGPLSLRRNVGAPRALTRRRQHFDDARGADATGLLCMHTWTSSRSAVAPTVEGSRRCHTDL